jgi:hypothetical protein
MSEQAEWKPRVGDWFIQKCSYCGEGKGCTDANPCPDCLKMCNRWVIASDHCGRDFFYGGGWCNRDGGRFMNETFSFVMTTDPALVDRTRGICHVSECIPIPAPVAGKPE